MASFARSISTLATRGSEAVTKPLTALVIGGGVAGPAAALFLKQAGVQAKVFEAYNADAEVGGGLQVAPNGVAVLSRLGVVEELTALGAANQFMGFRSMLGDRLSKVTNVSGAHQAINMRRADIHRVVVKTARAAGIPIAYGKRLESVSQDDTGVAATFTDGTTATADFLVAADGIHSRVRQCLLPDAPKPAYVGLIGYGGFVPVSRVDPTGLPPAGVMDMTMGRVGFFGISHGGRDQRTGEPTVMWWSNLPLPEGEVAGVRAKPVAEIKAALHAAHRGWHAPIEQLIDASEDIFRGGIYDVQNLPTWHRGRIVLIGDAAHAMSPNSGQGASCALEDSLYLAKAVDEAKGDLPKAFAAFEAARRPRVERINAVARQSGEDKKKVLGPVRMWVRDRFLSLVFPMLWKNVAKQNYEYKIDWTPSSKA